MILGWYVFYGLRDRMTDEKYQLIAQRTFIAYALSLCLLLWDYRYLFALPLEYLVRGHTRTLLWVSTVNYLCMMSYLFLVYDARVCTFVFLVEHLVRGPPTKKDPLFWCFLFVSVWEIFATQIELKLILLLFYFFVLICVLWYLGISLSLRNLLALLMDNFPYWFSLFIWVLGVSGIFSPLEVELILIILLLFPLLGLYWYVGEYLHGCFRLCWMIFLLTIET
jgi:hypothetical protein